MNEDNAMPATQQSRAIEVANGVIAVAAQINALCTQINDLLIRFGAGNVNTVMAALPTAAQNADGSLGTADGAPNAAHPIDPRVVPTIARAISSNDFIATVAVLQDVQKFWTGSAGTSVINRVSLIAPIVGG
jgi:hypothetical protein